MPRRKLHYGQFYNTPASPTCTPNPTFPVCAACPAGTCTTTGFSTPLPLLHACLTTPFCLCPMPRRNLHYGQFYNAIVVQGARPPVPPDMPSDYALLMQRCAVQTPLHAAAAWHATRNLHMEACCLWCLDRLTLCLRPGAPNTYATASRAAA